MAEICIASGAVSTDVPVDPTYQHFFTAAWRHSLAVCSFQTGLSMRRRRQLPIDDEKVAHLKAMRNQKVDFSQSSRFSLDSPKVLDLDWAVFAEHFVILEPRDRVGGDIYRRHH